MVKLSYNQQARLRQVSTQFEADILRLSPGQIYVSYEVLGLAEQIIKRIEAILGKADNKEYIPSDAIVLNYSIDFQFEPIIYTTDTENTDDSE